MVFGCVNNENRVKYFDSWTADVPFISSDIEFYIHSLLCLRYVYQFDKQRENDLYTFRFL